MPSGYLFIPQFLPTERWLRQKIQPSTHPLNYFCCIDYKHYFMPTLRSVAHIFVAQEIEMGHLPVFQALPTEQIRQIDPFLLLHHFGPFETYPGEDPLDLAPHPHRGFEPVTLMYSGSIRHKDSRGNEGIIGPGEVQWMTAGRGIIHSERASSAYRETGGTLEGIQLWVNLPQKDKMAQPRYQQLAADAFPTLAGDDPLAKIQLIAGNYADKKGPVETFSPLLLLRIDLGEGGHCPLAIPPHFNAALYILDGEVTLNHNFSYSDRTLLHFKNNGDAIALHARKPTRALLLAGQPLDEPLVQWGPYVMNDQTEIMEAMRDYQAGKMGFYID